jgi:hypothetical protein
MDDIGFEMFNAVNDGITNYTISTTGFRANPALSDLSIEPA